MVFRAPYGHAALLLALLAPGVAGAAPPAAKRRHTAPPAAANGEGQLSLEEIAVMLSSSSADEVRMAIESGALLGSADMVIMLAERVKAGLPPELLDTAVESLAVMNDPSTADVFVMLSRHRRPSVRARAVSALTSLRAPGAEAVLIRALGDSADDVRETAAQNLGQLRSPASVDALFKAFERGVANAGPALGKVIGEGDLPRILGALGRIPFTSLSPIFDGLFNRQDLGEAAKLRLVAALAELGTGEARGYLEGLRQKLPADASPRVRRAIDDAVVRIAQ